MSRNVASPAGIVAFMATRYRCAGCGNLTRFDVVSTRRTKAFHHFTIGGELQLEDEEVIEETVEKVTCRWCGSTRLIERLEQSEDRSGGQSERPLADQAQPA